jgi:diacylglycerol kinase (ATP)
LPGPVAVLANPRAGVGRWHGLLPAVLDRLAAGGHDIQVLSAVTRAQAEVACRAAVADGVAALVVVGGDGTVHLALQAVAGTRVPLGVVPTGTGNDFVRETIGPAAPLAAVDAIAAALAAGSIRVFDLARMTRADGASRWFGAVLAAGFDAVVNERANHMRWPRGPRRYDLAILRELARLRPRRYTLHLDGVPQEAESVLVAVGNTASYGGGMRICPAADPTDGLLDLVVAGRLNRTTLVRIKPRIYRGTHVRHPLVNTYRAREIRLAVDGAGDRGITGYADGERTYPLPVTVTCVPDALRLLALPGAGTDPRDR